MHVSLFGCWIKVFNLLFVFLSCVPFLHRALRVRLPIYRWESFRSLIFRLYWVLIVRKHFWFNWRWSVGIDILRLLVITIILRLAYLVIIIKHLTMSNFSCLSNLRYTIMISMKVFSGSLAHLKSIKSRQTRLSKSFLAYRILSLLP